MSAVDELRKWTWECSSLRAFMMISNPAKYASFVGQRLDGKAGPGTDKLDEGWYQDLLVRFTDILFASECRMHDFECITPCMRC